MSASDKMTPAADKTRPVARIARRLGPDLSPVERFALILLREAATSGHVEMSYGEIAGLMGCNRRSAIRVLDRLEALGYVSPNGRQTTHTSTWILSVAGVKTSPVPSDNPPPVPSDKMSPPSDKTSPAPRARNKESSPSNPSSEKSKKLSRSKLSAPRQTKQHRAYQAFLVRVRGEGRRGWRDRLRALVHLCRYAKRVRSLKVKADTNRYEELLQAADFLYEAKVTRAELETFGRRWWRDDFFGEPGKRIQITPELVVEHFTRFVYPDSERDFDAKGNRLPKAEVIRMHQPRPGESKVNPSTCEGSQRFVPTFRPKGVPGVR